ncbi:ABC transporter ATP-binding protein [Caldivirga maquilingensis]|uniref:ABC transporter related n=1 Tax=Caldivirga maquilingensis (strain ATCC 700844 / DSM 13496 / JCM 10307 / IC-167) TaxID=397948 RepID=A8MCR7_CALMQ|nr:ABC transporter ATP-binding protein [Caldivirga maquilingensis]ABW01573.1 ABC transporter related [Caldivirga maquilingensis IC-167]
MKCIDVEGLVKSFNGVRALDGLSFGVECSDSAALLGPNGAGKTTTMRIIAGLLKPDSGIVRVCGFNTIKEPRLTKACLGYLPEDAAPFMNLTVRENLEYVGLVRGLSNVKDAVEWVSQALGLDGLMNAQPASLSRGNRQRVALAMAIIHRPKVLLLDEPLNYLDIPTQENVIELLLSMRRNGTTMLISTHIMTVAERLANRVIMINRGRLIWEGSISELMNLVKPGERIEEAVARMLK